MKVIYSQEPIIANMQSIFLAGPTPRKNTVNPWRPLALQVFKEQGFDGTIYSPEYREGEVFQDYCDQIEWEETAMSNATVIMFWVPRNLKTMPGFTTNVEWGYWIAKEPSKLVLGTPDRTPQGDYLKYYARRNSVPLSKGIATTIENAINLLKDKTIMIRTRNMNKKIS